MPSVTGSSLITGTPLQADLSTLFPDKAATEAAIARSERRVVDVTHPDYGATGDGSTNDTAALQAALTAGAGKAVHVPPGTYNFTTLTISGDDTHLHLMAGAVLTKTGATTDGITVTGANCSISGPGKIVSPASWDATIVAWTYAVINVTADGFAARGVVLENVPKVGIGVRGNDVQILGCRIIGNYPSASYTGAQTGHYGITFDPTAATPKGDVVISGNVIRSCVQGVFLANYGAGGPSQGCTVTGNAFESCFDHGVYATDGVGHVVVGNTFLHCRLPVAVTGSYHNVSHNTITTDGTGALNDVVGMSIRNAIGCVVAGNTFSGDATSTVIDLPCLGTAGPIRDNLVEGNIIRCETGETTAIRVGAASGVVPADPTVVTGNVIRGNIIRCKIAQFQGAITVQAPSAVRGAHNEVSGNSITAIGTKEAYGVYLLYQDHATVDRNRLRWEADAAASVTIHALYVNSSLDCAITRNRVVVTAAWGTNITMRGYRDIGTADYNLVEGNTFLLDTTKLASAVALHTLAANSISRDNRTARAWPSRETGTGAPTATRPNGSLYLRTDGAAGSTLYVREGSAWVAK